MKRIDERDTMFARMSYREGSAEYKDYYGRNPEKKEVDDKLRNMPNICSEGTATFHPLHSPVVNAGFRFLADIKKQSEGQVRENKVSIAPEEMTQKIKRLAKYFGADLVGIAETKDYHYYSHRGRNSETYGQKIEEFHKYGLVFAVEMDRDMVNRAPQLEEIIEVTKGYIKAAVVGMWLSYYIRELGYAARNHMDGNYLVVAPLMAEDAGIGEIGRSGILVTKEYGPRIRLGVVTTDMPLIPGTKEKFGIKEFCKICKKCATTCLGKAISQDDISEINGEKRWQVAQEKCYAIWKKVGSDCGICLSTCPFSQEVSLELIEKMKGSQEVMGKSSKSMKKSMV